MVLTENILLLGSFYIVTAHAQLSTSVDCKKFPLNPLCSLSQFNKVAILDQQLSPAEPPHQQFRPNARANFGPWPSHFGRVPLKSQPAFRGRPELKATNSNRKKRFFFWYTPDILQNKMNLWKNKLQKIQAKDTVFQWKKAPKNNYLPYEEYDCVHGKLKPVPHVFGNAKNEGFFNLAAQPVLPASPLPLNEQLAANNKFNKLRKKAKPVNFAVQLEEDNTSEESDETKMTYIRDHAPQLANESNDSEESSSENKETTLPKNVNSDFELSPHGERIEFQVQGHNGPRTYIFGFDTGDGKNRQYRLEERMKDGTVKGQYGYYDARGKLRTIKYVARPMEGYKEKHHEMNLSDLS